MSSCFSIIGSLLRIFYLIASLASFFAVIPKLFYFFSKFKNKTLYISKNCTKSLILSIQESYSCSNSSLISSSILTLKRASQNSYNQPACASSKTNALILGQVSNWSIEYLYLFNEKCNTSKIFFVSTSSLQTICK